LVESLDAAGAAGARMNNLVMLDYDGVIVDSLDIFCRVCAETFREHGLSQYATPKSALALLDANWYDALAAAGVPSRVVDALETAYAAATSSDAPGAPAPFAGMPEVIERLARTNTVVVITSSHTDIVQRYLADRRIGGVTKVLGYDTDTNKSRKIQAARRRHGVRLTPLRSRYVRGGAPQAQLRLTPWYIGDTVGDILEARAAGVATVDVTWGWQDADKLRQAQPDRMADTPLDLLFLE
jgi:phosphoglycolate phosphatase